MECSSFTLKASSPFDIVILIKLTNNSTLEIIGKHEKGNDIGEPNW